MTSREGLIGARGEALSDVHERGKVLIGGEYWNAFSREPIAKGKKVEVVAVDGLNVEVRENR